MLAVSVAIAVAAQQQSASQKSITTAKENSIVFFIDQSFSQHEMINCVRPHTICSTRSRYENVLIHPFDAADGQIKLVRSAQLRPTEKYSLRFARREPDQNKTELNGEESNQGMFIFHLIVHVRGGCRLPNDVSGANYFKPILQVVETRRRKLYERLQRIE